MTHQSANVHWATFVASTARRLTRRANRCGQRPEPRRYMVSGHAPTLPVERIVAHHDDRWYTCSVTSPSISTVPAHRGIQQSQTLGRRWTGTPP